MAQKIRELNYESMEHGKKYEQLVARIAKNVKKVREKKAITQEEMVDYGFSYRHYQRIESGKHSFNLYTLYRLSEAFDVDVREFLK